MAGTSIALRLNCAACPPKERDGRATEFGLQDKKLALHPGVAQPDGAMRFDLAAGVEFGAGSEAVRLTGPFVHGRPGERFLYLGWRPIDGADDDWIRRWKITLDGITRSSIRALSVGQGLALNVAESGLDTVWIGGVEWKLFAIDRADTHPVA